MINVVVEEIQVDDVVTNDKSKYNSNNHWTNDEMPEDYHTVLQCGEAKYWINHFKTFKKIAIDPKEFGWLIKANEIGKVTGRFSQTYADELEDLIASTNADMFDGSPFFVRTNTVSLKYGCHGVGPYYDLQSVIESAVTCIHGHAPIYPGIQELQFYLMEWVEINPNKEFRMFICDNQVTCISQQYTTKRNNILSDIEDNSDRQVIATQWVNHLCTYWNENIRPVITHTNRYSIDIAILDSGEMFFIEINCFGKEYAAGSSLFHWILDEEKLYGVLQNTVYFRYAI